MSGVFDPRCWQTIHSFAVRSRYVERQVCTGPRYSKHSDRTILTDLLTFQYLGGSIALYPISIDEKDVLLLNDLPHTEVYPTFPYQSTEHGPDEKRQRQCHIHQIIEDRHGLLYAPDLGSDRVWILHRNALEAEVCGWLQCPSGTGPRHGVIMPS